MVAAPVRLAQADATIPSTATGVPLRACACFRHEALFYAQGDRGFVEGTLALVTRALASADGTPPRAGTDRASVAR